MELKDILPNEPDDDVRWDISGDLRGGEVGRDGAAAWAEFVTSRPLKLD